MSMYFDSGSGDNRRSATRSGEDCDSFNSSNSTHAHRGDEANATNDTLSDFEVASDSGKSVAMSGYSDCGFSLEDENGGEGEVGSDQMYVGQGQVPEPRTCEPPDLLEEPLAAILKPPSTSAVIDEAAAAQSVGDAEEVREVHALLTRDDDRHEEDADKSTHAKFFNVDDVDSRFRPDSPPPFVSSASSESKCDDEDDDDDNGHDDSVSAEAQGQPMSPPSSPPPRIFIEDADSNLVDHDSDGPSANVNDPELLSPPSTPNFPGLVANKTSATASSVPIGRESRDWLPAFPEEDGNEIDTSAWVQFGFRELMLEDRMEVAEREAREIDEKMRALEEERRVLEIRLDSLGKDVQGLKNSLRMMEDKKDKNERTSDRWGEDEGRDMVPTQRGLGELTLEERVEVAEDKDGGSDTVPPQCGLVELTLEDRVEVAERGVRERDEKLKVLSSEKEMLVIELAEARKKLEDELRIWPGLTVKDSDIATIQGRAIRAKEMVLIELEKKLEIFKEELQAKEEVWETDLLGKDWLTVERKDEKMELEKVLAKEREEKEKLRNKVQARDARIEKLEKGTVQYENMVAVWDDHLVKLGAQMVTLEAKLDEERVAFLEELAHAKVDANLWMEKTKAQDERRQELEMELMTRQQKVEVLGKSNANELSHLQTRIGSLCDELAGRLTDLLGLKEKLEVAEEQKGILKEQAKSANDAVNMHLNKLKLMTTELWTKDQSLTSMTTRATKAEKLVAQYKAQIQLQTREIRCLKEKTETMEELEKDLSAAERSRDRYKEERNELRARARSSAITKRNGPPYFN
ncbi:hypothetical protein K435DRAFT_839664 [Dendrothele bispora CBS 962.96]|uniref:Uncharacterized protein n=1 Tax=Dendrothele bispora (strain CBS 962.96) TaxID=1314807 RepID=A0A4S8LZB8_DENBC|nr:hypothetical protein K435DRAFT_839664 [Dendrothele bispora CBS 962.96]